MIDQHSSLSEKFLKKGFWLYFFGFIIAPIGYIVKIIVSQDLSIEEVGILYGIISLVTLLSAFSDFGIRESLSFFIPRYNTQQNYDKVKSILFYGFIIQFITGLLVFLVLFLGSTIIAEKYFNTPQAIEILKVFSFFFLGINLFQLINNFFMAVQNTFLQKVTEFIRMILVMLMILSIFFTDTGSLINYSYSWIFGLYCGVSISLVIFYFQYYTTHLKNSRIIFNKQLLKEILVYSSITFLSVQSFAILSQVDMQMVLYILGTKDAGFYTNYLSLVSIPNMVIGPIFFLLYPIFSELDEKKEHQKIRNIKSLFQRNFFVVSMAFSALFFVFATPIAYILFGEKFITSGIILQYSIIFIAWSFLLRVNHMLLASIGKITQRLYLVIFSIVINIVLNYIFILHMGVTGAALATGISWLIIWIISEIILKEYKVRFDFFFILKNITYLLIVSMILFQIKGYVLDLTSPRLLLFLYFSIIAIIYFFAFFMFNLKEVKVVIQEIRKIKKIKR